MRDMLRTPPSVTDEIQELCRNLNATATAVYISVTPDPGCEPNQCFFNVRRKVDAEGGRIQFGWAIWEWPRVFVEAEHHAVYEPPGGPPWRDISPATTPPAYRRLFLPDEAAVYDFDNIGHRRENIRLALADDPQLDEYLRLAEERVQLENSIPGTGTISLKGPDAQRLRRNEQQRTSIEVQLGMKYTPQGSPCFCGSGRKFKRCHGPQRGKSGREAVK